MLELFVEKPRQRTIGRTCINATEQADEVAEPLELPRVLFVITEHVELDGCDNLVAG